jgi:methylthioribulose-1-phosphate dehydratase
MKSKSNPFQTLIDCGKQFYERRWMWGTAGNLSVKVAQKPLEIAITPSGLNKGHLTTADLLRIKEGAKSKAHPRGLMPSAETVIHQAVHRTLPDCGAVFHVHPMYSTLISKLYGHPTERRYFKVEWFEMMKGVGVGEEQAAEIAVFPNWQDVSLIAKDIEDYITNYKGMVLPVVLIYNHGVTGWGKTADQARNHLEIMEYVCEYLYLKKLEGKAL